MRTGKKQWSNKTRDERDSWIPEDEYEYENEDDHWILENEKRKKVNNDD